MTEQAMTEQLATDLWDRFGKLSLDDVPASVRQVAHQCVLDWLGCALAGSSEPLAGILRDEFSQDEGVATLVGSNRRAGTLLASLVNGATGHALDFDDTHTQMGGHPTAPVLPAALALAEEQDRSGRDLLTALIVGLEIESQVGTAFGPEHYAKGWHQTATVGVFGAAAAASWLLGLNPEQFGWAFGIAASNAAGLKANFGTMTKPLHAGSAAERGLMAARLAARGFTANPDALGGNQGLAQAAGSGQLQMERFARWADDWLTPRTLFKYHAACYLTHAGIEATTAALQAGGVLRPSGIDAITLTVSPGILDVCGIPEPTTGLEAKFSLTGTQSLLVHGCDTGAIATYEDGPINRPEVQAFFKRVTVETDADLTTTQTRAFVVRDGQTHQADYDSGRPSVDLDEQGRKLRRKFDALAGPVVGRGQADTIAELVGTLPDLASVGTLTSLCRPAERTQSRESVDL